MISPRATRLHIHKRAIDRSTDRFLAIIIYSMIYAYFNEIQ